MTWLPIVGFRLGVSLDRQVSRMNGWFGPVSYRGKSWSGLVTASSELANPLILLTDLNIRTRLPGGLYCGIDHTTAVNALTKVQELAALD
jgi:hypothetical protein